MIIHLVPRLSGGLPSMYDSLSLLLRASPSSLEPGGLPLALPDCLEDSLSLEHRGLPFPPPESLGIPLSLP